MLGKGFIVLARREPDGDSAPVAYVADSLEAANLCLHDNCFHELLAALKDAEQVLSEILGSCEDDCECVLHPVRAAIAKAEQQEK